MKNKVISIVGAGGLIGSTLSNHLLASHKDWAVRGLQRSSNADIQAAAGHFEFRKLNLLDPSGFDAALDGSDVLIISVAAANGQENEIEHLGVVNLAKRAERLGIERIIYISGISTPDAEKWFKSGWAKRQAEVELHKLSIPVHIIRPSWMMESLARMVRNGKVSIIGAGKTPIHWLTASDLSRIVDHLITDPPNESSMWNVTGPEGIPLHDAAQRYAKSLGLGAKINALPLPVARLMSTFVKELRPIVELSRVYENFDEGNVANNLPANLRPTTTLENWLSRNNEK